MSSGYIRLPLEGGGGTGAVDSVNGQTGVVVLDTGDISEDGNLYFTDLRAQTAAVVNSLAGSQTDQAPSVAAVNAALAAISPSTIAFEQEVYVAKNGDDLTADGSLGKPYATIQAAMASITDASPTKRYAIKVEAGNYSETGDFELKANVFVMGAGKDITRIGATSFKLNADFSGSADNRSGFSDCTLLNPCDFDWDSVSSQAGKLYFNHVVFNSTYDANGDNNAIAQTWTESCVFFGAYAISGINAGVHKNCVHFNRIDLNQHPILPTIFNAVGGSAGQTFLTTTVNDFNRRCSAFLYNFWAGDLTVDGPVSYADATITSMSASSPILLNGGQYIPINPGVTGANTALSNLIFPTAVNNPIIPATTNATNFGDWGFQWFWNFGYVHASTGTDLFLISYPSAFGAETTAGKSIGIYADGAGLASDINGGDIFLGTAAPSGTGIKGRVDIDARELTMNNTKIVDLAPGTASTDAVNVGQLTSAFVDRYRADSAPIGDGVNTATITFSSALPTADYTITYTIVNTVDVNPKFLDVIVTNKSTTGFTVQFHQNTDSANYLIEYICIIHS